jgi:hypothetical protein
MKDGLLDWEELWWIEHEENEEFRAEIDSLRRQLDAMPRPLTDDQGLQVYEIIKSRASKPVGRVSAKSNREAIEAALKAGYRGSFRAVPVAMESAVG